MRASYVRSTLAVLSLAGIGAAVVVQHSTHSSDTRYSDAAAAAFSSESPSTAYASIGKAVADNTPAGSFAQTGGAIFRAFDAQGDAISNPAVSPLYEARADYPGVGREVRVNEYYSKAESEGVSNYCAEHKDFYVTCSSTVDSDGRVTLTQVQSLRVTLNSDGTVTRAFSADSNSPSTLKAVMPAGSDLSAWYKRSVEVVDPSTGLIASAAEFVEAPDTSSAALIDSVPVSTLTAIASDPDLQLETPQ